jgi:hypothetical protein
MACGQKSWGAFALAVREDLLPLVAIEQAALLAGYPIPKLPRRPKIHHWEMDRNDAICEAIEEYAPQFWATLHKDDPPDRLDYEDVRCGRCPRRIWCWGEEMSAGLMTEERRLPIRSDLEPLVEEYRKASADLKEREAYIEELERKFKEVLGPVTAVRVMVDGTAKNIIYRLRNGAERIDGRAMAVQYDNLRRRCIEANIAGADTVPPSSEYVRKSLPSRPLLLSGLLPKKPKKKGEVAEVDEAEDYLEERNVCVSLLVS